MDELTELWELAWQVGVSLNRAGLVLVTAESCTGGWVAECVTEVAGSSVWFDRGFVTYSNIAKTEMLGVEPALIATHGAVSEAVVLSMVAGALQLSRAHVALAISGIAGPSGGTMDKPVGTVWIAWQRKGRTPSAVCEQFMGNRRAIRQQAVRVALQGVLELCER